MSQLRRLSTLVTMLILIVASTIPVFAQESGGITIDEEPLLRDATWYASKYSIDLEEALYRFGLFDLAGELDAELIADEASTFAGLWLQHTPEFRIIVQFTNGGEETIRPYIENGPLANLVEVRTASVPLAELKSTQSGLLRTLDALNIPVESGINVFDNRVELHVTDPTQLNVVLEGANIQLPPHVRVITIARLSTPTTDIYAGLGLSTCTSGFSVKKNSTGTNGITTAGHCNNSQSYASTNLSWQDGRTYGSYDIQWHTIGSLTARNLIYDGTYNRYVYGTEHRNNQTLLEPVCKYGPNGGYGCGEIIDTAYRPTPANQGGYIANPNYTFIRVEEPGVDLAVGGDSGGPWFWNNTAYGIQSGEYGGNEDIAIYMAVNYISDLGLSVLTQ